MKSILYLPKSFSEFTKALDFDARLMRARSGEYAAILRKESSGEWIIDLTISLVVSMSRYEMNKSLAEIKSIVLPDFYKEISSSRELGHLYGKLWFYREEYRTKYKPHQASRKALMLEFRNIKSLREAGKPSDESMKKINSILITMQNIAVSKIENHLLKKRRIVEETRTKLVRGFFPHNFVDIFNRMTQKINSKSENPYKGLQIIGFGVNSDFKSRPVRRDSVVFDKNTLNETQSDKHILYAAGWSLREETDY